MRKGEEEKGRKIPRRKKVLCTVESEFFSQVWLYTSAFLASVRVKQEGLKVEGSLAT
jgi:hypothetical protein